MKTSLIALGLFLLIAGCKKSSVNPYHNTGVITGYDLRLCPSPLCGGLLITIKNDTAKNAPPYYHIASTLAQLGINESTKFPINVYLDYKPDTGAYGSYGYIIVTHIKQVN
jgi:hypothetical protein